MSRRRFIQSLPAIAMGLPALAVHAANPVVHVFKSDGCGWCVDQAHGEKRVHRRGTGRA